MISLTINAETVSDLHAQLGGILAGTLPAMPAGAMAGTSTGEVGNEPKQTAAQRKAADKAAKEVADKVVAAREAADNAASRETAQPTAEEAKQDAKDEAAEKAAEPLKLTHDSVRAMLGGYVQAFGMEAAQADGATMIGAPKISDLKDDQIAKAVIGIAEAIEKNPHKRTIAGDGITAEKLAELKPIVLAAKGAK